MVGSPPPWRAAMMMARLSLLHILPRFASMAPFLCLIVAQCECPDMAPPQLLVARGGWPLLPLQELQFPLDFLVAVVRRALADDLVQLDRLLPGVARPRGVA